MAEEQTPENNLILRQMSRMRRDMAEIMEREARVVELLDRVNARLDEGSSRVDRRLDELASRIDRQFHEISGDLLLMENRILTALTEVRQIAARLDEEASREDA